MSIEYSNYLPQNFKYLVPTPTFPLPPKKVPIPKINTMIRGRTKNNQSSCFFLVFATFVFFHFNKKRETAIFTRVLRWEDVSLKTFDRTTLFFWVFTHAFFNFSYWRLTLFNFYFYFHKLWIILTEPNACLMDIFSLHKKLKWS